MLPKNTQIEFYFKNELIISALSSMSSESGRSVRSTTSARSNVSQKSGVSNSSWFSIGSLSNFQASRILDSKAINRPPRVNKLERAP